MRQVGNYCGNSGGGAFGRRLSISFSFSSRHLTAIHLPVMSVVRRYLTVFPRVNAFILMREMYDCKTCPYFPVYFPVRASVLVRKIPRRFSGKRRCQYEKNTGYITSRDSVYRMYGLYTGATIVLGCASAGNVREGWGVTIIERVIVAENQFINMNKVGGYVSIPPRLSTTSKDILFWDESVTVLRDANPKVWRSEQLVKLSDGERVVARVVRYSRVGGDVPLSAAHSSYFGCPEEKDIFSQHEKIFVIGGEKK